MGHELTRSTHNFRERQKQLPTQRLSSSLESPGDMRVISPLDKAATDPGLSSTRHARIINLLRDIGGGIEPGSDAIVDLNARVTDINAGKSSQCFLTTLENQPVVIKLRDDADAESEVLKAWTERGVQVPAVVTSGTFDISQSQATQFVCMEAIMGEDGQPAPLVSELVGTRPEDLPHIAHLMGAELAKIHSLSVDLPYGKLADRHQETPASPSWNSYLIGIITEHSDFLIENGISEAQIQKIRQNIAGLPEPQERVFVHGDYRPSNVLLPSSNPMSIAVIDPNPFIGDRHWDLAEQYIQLEFQDRRRTLFPGNEQYERAHQREKAYFEAFFAGYADESISEIDEDLLQASQFAITIVSNKFGGKNAIKKYGEETGRVWIDVKKDMLRSQAERLSAMR